MLKNSKRVFKCPPLIRGGTYGERLKKYA